MTSDGTQGWSCLQQREPHVVLLGFSTFLQKRFQAQSVLWGEEQDRHIDFVPGSPFLLAAP